MSARNEWKVAVVSAGDRDRAMQHIPVMVDAVVELLLGGGAKRVLDGTVGAGGHAEAILDARDDVTLLGVDRDPDAIALASSRLNRFGDRYTLVEGVYSDVAAIVGAGQTVDAALLDLGVSSMQIDMAERGFSYSQDGPLDMRMSGDGRSARSLLHDLDAEALAGVLRNFGEVRRAGRVARAIHAAAQRGEMERTADVVGAVRAAIGAGASPAELSRVFQAIRIAVNHELDLLSTFLEGVLGVLADGGRLVVMSYHSLEDRLVKDFLRKESARCLCPPEIPMCVCGHTPRLRVLTRRPLRPAPDEIRDNPRSRSVRLRAAEAIGSEVLN
jgi:16S rRNA (cytosine1402-N4)-methyltransferase